MTERFNCTKCDARMMTPAEARAHDCHPPAVPAPQQGEASLEEEARRHAESEGDNGNAEISFLAGAQAGARREREKLTKDFFLELVREWKFFWMDQKQNSQADYENYHRRAFGIDANMQHDLAVRLTKRIGNGKS